MHPKVNRDPMAKVGCAHVSFFRRSLDLQREKLSEERRSGSKFFCNSARRRPAEPCTPDPGRK